MDFMRICQGADHSKVIAKMEVIATVYKVIAAVFKVIAKMKVIAHNIEIISCYVILLAVILFTVILKTSLIWQKSQH